MHFSINNKTNYNRQTGLALISVLFIFALVSMLAISMVDRQQRDIAQATATFENTQAYILALSAEEVVKAGLIFDADRDSSSNEQWDTSAELWNQVVPLEIEGARIKVSVRDLQGLFNLNWLHEDSGKQAASFTRFQSLLGEIGLDTTIATNLKHWFTPGAGFNYEYQNQEPPYSASEIPMIHPSELLLVSEVTAEAYRKLEPFITALPPKTPLNINTTLPEIIGSWDVGLTLDGANNLVSKTRPGTCEQDRATAVYKTVDEFLNEESVSALTDKDKFPNHQWVADDFDVKTEYFSVFITIELNERVLVLESIIKRDPDSAVVAVYRDFSRAPSIDDHLVKNANCTG